MAGAVYPVYEDQQYPITSIRPCPCTNAEAVFAREVDGGFSLPPFADRTLPNFGMIFPQPVEIARRHGAPENVLWFPVDPGLLEIARKLQDETALVQCTAKNECL
jgi:adenosylhomocysteine nucleosidase